MAHLTSCRLWQLLRMRGPTVTSVTPVSKKNVNTAQEVQLLNSRYDLESYSVKLRSLPQHRCLSTLNKKLTIYEAAKFKSTGAHIYEIKSTNRNYSTSVSEGGNFISSTEGGLRTITIDRPKANAFTIPMFSEFRDVLKEAAEDPDTTITAITGKGRFYSSGLDLVKLGENLTVEAAETLIRDMKVLTDDIIDFPKPLIALVNGPAIGIMVSWLGLMDAVYASDKASFSTPYSALGTNSEGCASFTFPLIMGRGMATEMLIFNKSINELEAQGVQKCFLSPQVSAAIQKFTRVKKK